MRITHTTTLRNLESIREYGLLCSFARQGMPAVWFHQERLCGWAMTHVRMKHDAPSADLVHITFDVPRGWLRKHASGIFYCKRDVPSSRIKRIRIVRTLVEEVTV